MKRILPLALLTIVATGCISVPNAPPAGRPAYIYGDSVVIQAEPYLKRGFTQRALIGSSPCGYYVSGTMQADAPTNPSVVVLMFIGLYDGHWCEDKGSAYQSYLYDFQMAKSIFPNAKVYAVMPPATHAPAPDNSFVAQAAQAAQSAGLIVFDARTPLDGYARYSDGWHLLADGSQKLAELLSTLYKGGSRP